MVQVDLPSQFCTDPTDVIEDLLKLKIKSKSGAEKLSLEERVQKINAFREIGIDLGSPHEGWRSNKTQYQFAKIILNRCLFSLLAVLKTFISFWHLGET